MNEYVIKEDNKTSITSAKKETIYNSKEYIGDKLVYIGQGEDGYHKYIVKYEK